MTAKNPDQSPATKKGNTSPFPRMNALFVTIALLLGALWPRSAQATSILEVGVQDLLADPATRWWVVREIMARESRFLTPGIGWDVTTGAPFDGWILEWDSGRLLGPPRIWSSPSKDYQQLIILALALAGNSLAQQALVPDDPAAARALALEVLAKKMATFERFNSEFRGFGGNLPWYLIENGRIKPADSLVPSGNWERRSAGLDCGEFLCAVLMTAHVLRSQGEEDLAVRYQAFFDQSISNAVTIFLDRSVMKLRAEAAILDPQGAVVPENYSTLGTAFLDDSFEGQMLVLLIELFGNLSAEDAATLWANSHLVRLDTVIDGQGFSLRRGYWFSSHEQFPWLVLPLDESPTAKAVFILGERARSRFAAAEGELLAASCNPPVPRTGRDYIDPPYLSNLGIPGLGSQSVQRGVFAPYPSFSVALASPDSGLAWLLETLKVPKMWGPYGMGESFSSAGWYAPCLTWDGKALVTIALASSFATPAAPELMKAALQHLGKYDQYVQLLEGKYAAVFGQAPLVGGDVAFGLPNAPIPVGMAHFNDPPATENLLERRFDTSALPGVVVNRDAGKVAFSSAGGFIWAPVPETDLSLKPILNIHYSTNATSLVWVELKNSAGEVIVGPDIQFPNAPHIRKLRVSLPNTAGRTDSLQLDLRPILNPGISRILRVIAFSDPSGSAELSYFGLAAVSATHLMFEVPDRVVSGQSFGVSVKALDLSGNVVEAFNEQINLTPGRLSSGPLVATAVNGWATFDNLVYTASADGESFVMSADDQAEVGSDLLAVTSRAVRSDVVATQLRFAQQPSGAVISGTEWAVQPVVWAVDDNGVLDQDFSESLALQLASGPGALAGVVSALANGGVTVFRGGLKYSATQDHEPFALTVDDQADVGTDLPVASSNDLTADAVGSHLVFTTQPAPTSVANSVKTTFSPYPVLEILDPDGIRDLDYNQEVLLVVTGPGTAVLEHNRVVAVEGRATFQDLELTYSAHTSNEVETFSLEVRSGSLASGSTNLTVSVQAPPPSAEPPASAPEVPVVVVSPAESPSSPQPERQPQTPPPQPQPPQQTPPVVQPPGPTATTDPIPPGKPQIRVAQDRLDLGNVVVGDSTGKVIELTNEGGGWPTIWVSINSGDRSSVKFAPASVRVKGGKTEKVSVQFQPIGVGRVESILTIDDGDKQQFIIVTGVGSLPSPSISTDLSTIDFGTSPAGTHLNRELRVYNKSGQAALNISSIHTSDASISVDRQTLTIVPGDSAVLIVHMNLKASVLRATLSISSNAEPLTIVIMGTGLDLAPPETPTLRTPLVVSDQITLNWISADRAGDLDHIVVYMSRTDGFEPALADSIGSVDTPATTFTMKQNSVGIFYLRVQAVDRAGNRSALSIQQSIEILAKGNTAPRPFQISPDSLNFSILIGTQAEIVLSVKSLLKRSAVVTVGIRGEAGPTQFAVSVRRVGFRAGMDTTISVSFRPTSLGRKTEKLVLSTAGVAPIEVPLIGVAVTKDPAILTVSPRIIAFPDTRLGSTRIRTLTLRNQSKGIAVIKLGLSSGADSTQYALSARQVVLRAGRDTSLTITFRPTVNDGRKTATVVLYTAAAGRVEIPVSGTATKGRAKEVLAEEGLDNSVEQVILAPNYPNPFNPETTLNYQLPEAGPVRLLVFDVLGQLVRVLVDERQEVAGVHVVYWDGKDDQGRRVNSGIYLARLEAVKVTRFSKMTLIR